MSLSAIAGILLLPAVPADMAAAAQTPPAAGVEMPAEQGETRTDDPPPPTPEPDVQPPAVVRTVPPAAPGQEGAPQPGASDIVVTARGEAPPGDPLQQVNIESYKAAQAVDKAFVGPVAMGYKNGVPKPIRDGIGNVLRNLREPINFLNFLLQFKIGKAAETFGRFAINSTVGVAGVFDVAKKKPFNLPYRSNGFANTLGFYGVEPGPYFFVPLVGPTTLRDMIGDGLDLLVLPTAVGKPFDRAEFAIPTTVVNRLNDRIDRDEEIRRLQEESADPDVETRTLYLEMRQREIDALKGKSVGKAPAGETPPTAPTPQAAPPTAPAGTQMPAGTPPSELLPHPF